MSFNRHTLAAQPQCFGVAGSLGLSPPADSSVQLIARTRSVILQLRRLTIGSALCNIHEAIRR